MSWDLDGGADKTSFTKFPVGVTRIRVLSDAPHMRWTHWMNQYRRSVTCPGRGCPIDAIRKEQKEQGLPYSYNMSRAFALNIYNHDTERYEIMEQGITFMEDLKAVMTDLKEDERSLKDVVLRVRRRGTGSEDTSYRIDIDSEAAFDSAEQKAHDNQLDLTEYFKPHTIEQITALLETIAQSPEQYKEAWKEVMSAESTEEQITVE